MAVATTFWFIVAVSLLSGLGGATYHAQASALIVSAYSERRGRMLGIHGWGASAGQFLAPAVAVFAISAFSWRLAMAAISIPMLVTAAMVRMKLDKTTATPLATVRGVLSRQL
jgi:MFS family permease